MMNWWLLFVLSVTIAVFSTKCENLSKEENEKRKEECGKQIAAKIFGGRKTNREHSPWTVYQKMTDGKKNIKACTATVVSPRHVLTAAHCIAKLNSNRTGFEKIEISGESIREENCKEDDYVIEDESIAGRVVFYEGENITDQFPMIGKAKKISLINVCKLAERPADITDLAVIELEKNLTLGPTINMACVSNSVSDIAGFITLDFYGYGIKPAEGHNTDGALPIMLYEETHILQPQFSYRRPQNASDSMFSNMTFYARSSEEKFIACEGDFGGGATRMIFGKTTVVGVLSDSTCEKGEKETKWRKELGTELFVPLAIYEDKICKHSGICVKNHSKSHCFLAFVLLFVIKY